MTEQLKPDDPFQIASELAAFAYENGATRNIALREMIFNALNNHAAETVQQLQRENDRLRLVEKSHYFEVDQLRAELAAAKQQLADKEAQLSDTSVKVETLRPDAERYLWLKAWNKTDGFDDCAIDRERAVDKAFAAARAAHLSTDDGE